LQLIEVISKSNIISKLNIKARDDKACLIFISLRMIIKLYYYFILFLEYILVHAHA